MKKSIISILVIAFLLCAGNGFGQTNATKMATAENPTPANVLKWTKEVLPRIEPLVPKLEKIKADHPAEAHNVLKTLAMVNMLKESKAKGNRLKADEARKTYDFVMETINLLSIDCQSHNGGVCCQTCNPHGFLGIWCFVNCFTIKPRPGIN